jgi:dolichol-phosphate mannosyltransferase
VGRNALSPTTASERPFRRVVSPIGLVVSAGVLADWLLFRTALSLGSGVSGAHIASFSIVASLAYIAVLYKARSDTALVQEGASHAHLLVSYFFALFLRGGVLALFTKTADWSPSAAIIPSIACSAFVMWRGFKLSLLRRDVHDYWREFFLHIIAYTFFLRLIYMGLPDLLPEEAYYWNYSRHLDIGYLDHPPMVAWLIRLGTAVFGFSELGVRFSALCCWGIACTFVYRLTLHLFDKASALAALALMQILPYFFFTGMLMTPEAPLAAAWAGALYFLERALVAQKSSSWLWVGASLGFGLLSKYSIGLLGLATVVFVLLDPASRHWLKRWQPYAAAVLALAIFSPTLIWNAQNHWASFAFQTVGRLAQKRQFAPHKLLGAALVLLTPTGLIAASSILLSRKTVPVDAVKGRTLMFMRVFTLVPLTVFFVFSLQHEVKLEWTGPLWLAVLPALANQMIRMAPSPTALRKPLRMRWGPTLIITVLVFGGMLHYLVLGFPKLGYGEKMELVPVGWSELGREIDKTRAAVRAETGAEPLIVGMDRYAIASEAAFYSTDPGRTANESAGSHLFGGVSLMYELWFPAKLQAGRTLVLVAWSPDLITGPRIELMSEHLGPVSEGVLNHNGKFIRRYYYRTVYGYRPAAGI